MQKKKEIYISLGPLNTLPTTPKPFSGGVRLTRRWAKLIQPTKMPGRFTEWTQTIRKSSQSLSGKNSLQSTPFWLRNLSSIFQSLIDSESLSWSQVAQSRLYEVGRPVENIYQGQEYVWNCLWSNQGEGQKREGCRQFGCAGQVGFFFNALFPAPCI